MSLISPMRNNANTPTENLVKLPNSGVYIAQNEIHRAQALLGTSLTKNKTQAVVLRTLSQLQSVTCNVPLAPLPGAPPAEEKTYAVAPRTLSNSLTNYVKMGRQFSN